VRTDRDEEPIAVAVRLVIQNTSSARSTTVFIMKKDRAWYERDGAISDCASYSIF